MIKMQNDKNICIMLKKKRLIALGNKKNIAKDKTWENLELSKKKERKMHKFF